MSLRQLHVLQPALLTVRLIIAGVTAGGPADLKLWGDAAQRHADALLRLCPPSERRHAAVVAAEGVRRVCRWYSRPASTQSVHPSLRPSSHSTH